MSAFLSVQEAADFLGVSKSCAYAAIDAGEFPVDVVRVGRRIKVPAAALHALAGTNTDAVPSPTSASPSVMVAQDGRGAPLEAVA